MKSVLTIAMTTALLFGQYPKIGNYFLDAIRTDSEVDSLALCDFIVLDHQVARDTPEKIEAIRAKNPNIQIIAYIVSQEMNPSYASWEGSLTASMLPQIKEEWWLKTTTGAKVTFWPGTYMLNIAAGHESISSVQWNHYLADIVVDSILSNDLWDGAYLDNCWNAVSWMNERTDGSIDFDQDGLADDPNQLDSLWESGMNVLLNSIRLREPNKIVVGNGGYRYKKWLNGALYEDFPRWGGWWRLTDIYLDFDSTSYGTPFNLINGTTDNSGTISLKDMRFQLGSALLGDGYFSYDYGADDHSQNWWFDEYSIDLGNATSQAQLFGMTEVTFNDFNSGADGWKIGDWKMNATITDGQFSAVVTGEEQWNELLRSPELTIAEGAHFKLSFHLSVDSVQPGAEFFANLRKGDLYDQDINLGTMPISAGIDSTITFYSDSAFSGTGYALMIGMKEGGSVSIDSITLYSDESLYAVRTFEKGMVVVNPSPQNLSLAFPGYLRFEGVQDPVHNNGEDGSTITVPAQDAYILITATGQTPVQTAKAAQEVSVSMKEKSLLVSVGEKQNGAFTLRQLNGRVHFAKAFAGTVQQNLSSLAAGIYILSVQENGRSVVQRTIAIP